MDEIALKEKAKYDYRWKTDYKASQCAEAWAEYIYRASRKGERLLDIGCGDGTTVKILRYIGFDCRGADITLAGCKNFPNYHNKCIFYEAPAWNISFARDHAFDFTFSTDFLEHLPQEKVEASIQEIFRITKKRTFHCVAIFPDTRDGVELHLTIKPIEWWQEIFNKFNTKGIETRIISRKDFLLNKDKT